MQNKQLLYDLFEAYYDCRKNKRNTTNSIHFELNYESNIIKLWQDILNDRYEIWKSIAFIVEKPVKREIFAWDFRDRIIHHYVINKLNLYFEKYFIFDSYSCRVWKWTLFWIKRVEKFIRSCSENYTKDCYVLKLDIQWFFMSIDKDILYKKLKEFISCSEWLQSVTTELITWLVEKIIYNDSTKSCIIKWNSLDWQGLPKSKSLFFTKGNTGLPIWNLTSQVFANFYLDKLDKFIKQKLKIKYYGRYVDDMVLVHKDNEYLKYCKKEINLFLINELKLTLHPNKIYLQHYSKWVLFLWSYIKPYRNYLRNKTKWNIFQKIQVLNNVITENKWKMNNNISQKFRQTINSYIWLIKWNNSYKLRKKILLNQVSVYFWNYFYVSDWIRKVVKK